MRSTTVFLIFGGIIIAVIVLSALSSKQTSSHPAMQMARTFMRAVIDQDVAKLEAITDTETAKVMKAGSSLSGIHFTAVTPFQGAFSKRPEVSYTYAELQKLAITDKSEPTITEALATVPLTNGGKMYLKMKNSRWTVLYISKPEDEQR